MATRRRQPPPGQELDADDYLEAAKDDAAALSSLYSNGDYSLVIYVSGVAAECLFRAFRATKRMPFRSDHPLASLAEEAGFPDLVPDAHRERFDAALAD